LITIKIIYIKLSNRINYLKKRHSNVLSVSVICVFELKMNKKSYQLNFDQKLVITVKESYKEKVIQKLFLKINSKSKNA